MKRLEEVSLRGHRVDQWFLRAAVVAEEVVAVVVDVVAGEVAGETEGCLLMVQDFF